MRSHAKAASAGSTIRENGAFSLGVIAAMLLCAAAFLGIGAPAASAAPEATPGYGFKTSFAQGEVNGPAFGPPRSPIAVGAEGKLFVLDESAGFVNVFGQSSNGGGFLITRVNTNLAGDVAVDPADDTLYAQDRGFLSGEPKIVRFLSNGKATPTFTQDPGFEAPAGEGIAVDPGTHDLLVANGAAENILRYNTAGALVDTIATPGVAPLRIAVAADGSIYVSGESNLVTHFSAAGAQLDQLDAGAVPQALAVDRKTGAIVVGFPDRLYSYSPAGALWAEMVPPNNAELFGAAVDPIGGRLFTFVRGRIDAYVPGLFPDVENFAVSNIQNHSAHVSAEIDPGVAPGDSAQGIVFVEYSADGGQTWTALPSLGMEMQGPGALEYDLEQLLINTDYLVRLRIRNQNITRFLAPIAFSTPEVAPEISTGSATDIGPTSAVINGAVNPAGFATTYHFEYGLTSSYGARVPLNFEGVAGSGRNSKIYRYRITGLTPNTTYHYRVVAESSLGVSQGEDRTFTTSPEGGLPQRAFEQVTPVDKKGNPLDPGIGFYAADDGSAFSYMNRGGESSSPQMSFAMSRRGATDWQSGIDLTDPIKVNSNVPGALLATTLIAVSPDFTHSFLATNKALTPGGVEGGTNLYVKDLATGAYTLVAGVADPFGWLNFLQVQQQNKLVGLAPDLSWVVFWSPSPLVEGAVGNDLYRWSESGGLELISVLPNGELGPFETGNDKEIAARAVSEDGSRIYFTSLYGSEAGVFLREAGKPTKSISVSQVAGEPTSSRSARLLGISKDGRYAFFAAREGKLTDEAPGNNGDVYRYDADDGGLEYLGGPARDATGVGVGVSDDGDTVYWSGAETEIFVWRDGVVHQATPTGIETGSFLSMSSNGRYLGYEWQGGVYLYDAETDERFCASCLPDGTPAAAQMGVAERFNSSRVPRAVTEDGALFFTTAGRLVAADTNGLKDVYTFEDGQPSLISPGNGAFEAIFAEVTPDGSDVFFSTAQKLVVRDNDESTDIYDARLGGGFAVQNPPPPQECIRDDCKATPNAGPELPFGGSEALSGPENVKPKPRKKCGKGKRAKKVKGKVRCVKFHKANKAGKGGNR